MELEGQMNLKRMQVQSVNMDDTSNITCTANNIVGPDSRHFSLIVHCNDNNFQYLARIVTYNIVVITVNHKIVTYK